MILKIRQDQTLNQHRSC